MPKFGKRSLNELATCHPDLQKVFNEVIKHYDCSILKGNRGEKEQNEAFDTGKSKLRYPNSNHNKMPSVAIDAAPYPIDWSSNHKNMYRYYHFAGFVLAIAASMGIKLRWGGDWDGDNDFSDQNFNDLPHFELIE